jgi:hypothetical protein
MDFSRMFRDLLTVGGIAGVIGIIITGTICYRYAVHGPEDVPPLLSHALTTILGFYFGATAGAGAAAMRAATPEIEPPH